jgi:hypothetical protein
MATQPIKDMRRRQRRQRKVHALRQRLLKTTSYQERQRIIAKIKKASPTAPVPEK